jgi:Phage Tail Collar Domain
MKNSFFILCFILFICRAWSQNVGVGTTTPTEKLDVDGKIKMTGLAITTGGSPYDFLQKNSASGQVGFKKGHGGLAIHYIICVQGCSVPSATMQVQGPYLSEIRVFVGDFSPPGWMFCEGQVLLKSEYEPLFPLLLGTYGGNGTTTFGLPDLRSAVPVGSGTSTVGNTWTRGFKAY